MCTNFAAHLPEVTGIWHYPKWLAHYKCNPLFKKGEHYKAANYRPVSLTSIFSKLMEHVIASQLMGHLNTNNIFYDLQHGFQDKHSCETQLLALVHELAHGVIANKQTDMAILDFSKAFDKVTIVSYISFSGMELTPSHMLGLLTFSEIGPKQWYWRVKLLHQCQ